MKKEGRGELTEEPFSRGGNRGPVETREGGGVTNLFFNLVLSESILPFGKVIDRGGSRFTARGKLAGLFRRRKDSAE